MSQSPSTNTSIPAQRQRKGFDERSRSACVIMCLLEHLLPSFRQQQPCFLPTSCVFGKKFCALVSILIFFFFLSKIFGSSKNPLVFEPSSKNPLPIAPVSCREPFSCLQHSIIAFDRALYQVVGRHRTMIVEGTRRFQPSYAQVVRSSSSKPQAGQHDGFTSRPLAEQPAHFR